MNVFTYGSLMYPPVWQRIVQYHYEHNAATIYGYERVGVRDEPYPMLVPAGTSSVVEGVLYRNITPDDLARLDAFEGDFYDRISVDVVLTDGSVVQGMVYLANAYGRQYALETPWDMALFEAEGMQRFNNLYDGYERIR
ncbi:gamma-glutamylcyclotransferase family protein [Teredinibacter turnerae]|uniref:Putative gamma-glutamylcyclotransferase n=1 Tax=Teredinibacter turnerae (strain ATCC 39867 / T7901) TaxID=377629 RepID=C5BKY8_TERTT|nr:gamma-glutamylcyclotransferase family protein [Teredinibacter turnerae]ACR12087.1 conserved hypothetical protein [Teredinibacter turnerae T7901]